MRSFLLKIAVALVLALALHAAVAPWANGYLDDFYLRFTAPPQRSLIVGTSRAAQGIKPTELHAVLPRGSAPFYNYAFTLDHSPFGPTYAKAIRAVLDSASGTGHFIVTVDPWSVSDVMEHGAVVPWPEAQRMLGEQCTYHASPNLEYLVRHAPAGWGSFLGGPLHDVEPLSTLQPDGWLKVEHRLDSVNVNGLTRAKLHHYEHVLLPKYRPSAERWNWLVRTVRELDRHGTVKLVRMPVPASMQRIEARLWPGFGLALARLAHDEGVDLYDANTDTLAYTYLDGNHLDTLSAARFSSHLARRLFAAE